MIKKHFYLIPTLFLLSFFFSCETIHYYQTVSKNYKKISSIPTFSHTNDVPVFFPGEKLPEDKYVKTAIVHLKKNGDLGYSDFLNDIKKNSQTLGADAALILNKNIVSEYDSRTQTSVEFITIKHIKKIDYLDQFVKTKKVFEYDSVANNYQLVETLNINFNKKIIETIGNNRFYEINFKPYSLDLILFEKSNKWVYTTKNDTLMKRYYYINGKIIGYVDTPPTEEYSFSYTSGKISSVKLEVDTYIDEIVFIYNSDGKVQYKELLISGKVKLLEIFIYDESQKLIGKV